MTLGELLWTASWAEVQAAFVRNYPWQSKLRSRYRRIFRSLRAMAPVPGRTRLLIEMVEPVDPDERPFASVSGLGGTLERDTVPCSPADRDTEWGRREVRYGLSTTRWREWLGMTIEPETLQNFRPAQILALCFYEMTWDGLTEADIAERLKSYREPNPS